MERWVAIILGLLVIIIGFLVVQNLQEGTQEVDNTGDDVECLVYGGTCVQGSCAGEGLGEELRYACGGERTCCART